MHSDDVTFQQITSTSKLYQILKTFVKLTFSTKTRISGHTSQDGINYSTGKIIMDFFIFVFF